MLQNDINSKGLYFFKTISNDKNVLKIVNILRKQLNPLELRYALWKFNLVDSQQHNEISKELSTSWIYWEKNILEIVSHVKANHILYSTHF